MRFYVISNPRPEDDVQRLVFITQIRAAPKKTIANCHTLKK